MKLRYTIIAFIITITVNSQYYSYSSINQTAIAVSQRTSVNNNITNVTVNDYSRGLSLIANELSAFRNSWENKAKREEAAKNVQSQISLIKSNYTSSEHFPQKIIDGWHSVMVTDSYKYCSPAKVLVLNNTIKNFVIGNWSRLSYPFTQLSSIVKGKCLLNVEFDKNTTDASEVYFMYDLEEPTIVDPPLNSGQVHFSSKIGSWITIWFNKNEDEKGQVLEKNKNSVDEYSLILEDIKPGVYNFIGKRITWGRNNLWNGVIEVKENLILKYELSKENQK
jgi:hypothetical protein